MLERKIEFHPEAYAELEQSQAWYESQTAGLGGAFLDEFERAIDAIQESPSTWPAYEEGTQRFLLHRFPFAIIYRHDENTIQVLAVMHLHRRPGYWRHRAS
jgi:toxin ParE2